MEKMQSRIPRVYVGASLVFVTAFFVLTKPDSVRGDDVDRKTWTFRGEVIDADNLQPIGTRISIRSSTGTWYFPTSTSSQGSAIEYRRQAGPNSLEQHVTLSPHPFEVQLPCGTYTIRIERGKEYVPVSKEIVIDQQNVEARFSLARWIHMAKGGWYSGDIHAHRPLADVPNLVLAEDLNVAMPLSHWVTIAQTSPVDGNRIVGPVPEPKWISVDATHGIYPLNTEFEIFTVSGKPHTLGAVLILGQSEPIHQGLPPVRRVAERAHQTGAFLDLEKHSWAWTPMIVPLMKPDLFELVNNHCWPTEFAFHSWTFDMAPKSMQLETNSQGFTEWGWIEFGLKSYYAYLNCGFRMMPSAGTGSGVHPVPLGFGRVYVHVPGEFTYEKWRDGLLAGNSFVTTGPMLQLTFNGEPAGHRFVDFRGEPAGISVRIQGTVQSLAPLDRIEVIVNGNLAKTLVPSDVTLPAVKPHQEMIDETIMIEGSGWLAIRCFESRPDRRIRFAHTAPVFVDVPGKAQSPFKDEVEHFVNRIEREIQRNRETLTPDELEEYQEALSIYRDLRGRAVERSVRSIEK
jgi:hypothetical protein